MTNVNEEARATNESKAELKPSFQKHRDQNEKDN
jgi:hypothetical protein